MPWDDPTVLWGIAGIIVGLIGIIVSAFSFFCGKSKKLLEHRMESTQLITEKMTSVQNLKLTIDDQPIESLASTTIKFINSGNQSIFSSDFAPKEPLGVTITGHLYGHDVFADNQNSIPLIQPFDNKTYHITFDFLKPKQSFSITLIHNGTLEIIGELMDGKRRKYRNNSRLMRECSQILYILFYAFIVGQSMKKALPILLPMILSDSTAKQALDVFSLINSELDAKPQIFLVLGIIALIMLFIDLAIAYYKGKDD